jgi:hypothetical protein
MASIDGRPRPGLECWRIRDLYAQPVQALDRVQGGRRGNHLVGRILRTPVHHERGRFSGTLGSTALRVSVTPQRDDADLTS